MKYSMPVVLFTPLLAALLLCGYNAPLWNAVLPLATHDSSMGYLFVANLFVSLLLLMNALLTLLAWPYLLKPLAMGVLLIAAVVFYFMNTFGAIIDWDMMQNVFETHKKEALDLITPGLFLVIAVGALLPALFLAPLSLRYPTLRQKGAILGLSLLVTGGLIFAQYKDYAIFFRNHRHIRHMINPVNALYGTYAYVKKVYSKKGQGVAALGTDAILGPAVLGAKKKSLLVLVVGETARADNFSLQGYARQTNPELERSGGLYFKHVTSCGTSTAHALPCMFSNLTREGFSKEQAMRSEGLLDVLRRAGVHVIWRDNNSGCKGVCERVIYEDLAKNPGHPLCQGNECFDGVLREGLQTILDQHGRQPLVIVLHQIGSHGPAYYKRYPKEYRRFTPTCDEAEIEHCPQQSIVNTYDNTLLYTDHELAEVVKLLEKNADHIQSSMIYLSDHGESLGEDHLYLHGLPFFIAPSEQTHIPLFAWISQEMRASLALDQACMVDLQEASFSQDNLFHTVLGLMDVRSAVYREELDILARCRDNVAGRYHAGL